MEPMQKGSQRAVPCRFQEYSTFNSLCTSLSVCFPARHPRYETEQGNAIKWGTPVRSTDAAPAVSYTIAFSAALLRDHGLVHQEARVAQQDGKIAVTLGLPLVRGALTRARRVQSLDARHFGTFLVDIALARSPFRLPSVELSLLSVIAVELGDHNEETRLRARSGDCNGCNLDWNTCCGCGDELS